MAEPDSMSNWAEPATHLAYNSEGNRIVGTQLDEDRHLAWQNFYRTGDKTFLVKAGIIEPELSDTDAEMMFGTIAYAEDQPSWRGVQLYRAEIDRDGIEYIEGDELVWESFSSTSMNRAHARYYVLDRGDRSARLFVIAESEVKGVLYSADELEVLVMPSSRFRVVHVQNDVPEAEGHSNLYGDVAATHFRQVIHLEAIPHPTGPARRDAWVEPTACLAYNLAGDRIIGNQWHEDRYLAWQNFYLTGDEALLGAVDLIAQGTFAEMRMAKITLDIVGSSQQHADLYGMRTYRAEIVNDGMDYTEGDELVWVAFSPTSGNRAHAQYYALDRGYQDARMFEIANPQDLRALLYDSDEAEVLAMPGSRFQVLRIDTDVEAPAGHSDMFGRVAATRFRQWIVVEAIPTKPATSIDRNGKLVSGGRPVTLADLRAGLARHRYHKYGDGRMLAALGILPRRQRRSGRGG